uniref:GATA-type domain-containing protein n=1 Tax=Mycena chlorophos TaxID=658473 RepID=A0ABQ0M021_MYCCL|nr:predicted protein [Mycena chlorophos]
MLSSWCLESIRSLKFLSLDHDDDLVEHLYSSPSVGRHPPTARTLSTIPGSPSTPPTHYHGLAPNARTKHCGLGDSGVDGSLQAEFGGTVVSASEMVSWLGLDGGEPPGSVSEWLEIAGASRAHWEQRYPSSRKGILARGQLPPIPPISTMACAYQRRETAHVQPETTTIHYPQPHASIFSVFGHGHRSFVSLLALLKSWEAAKRRQLSSASPTSCACRTRRRRRLISCVATNARIPSSSPPEGAAVPVFKPWTPSAIWPPLSRASRRRVYASNDSHRQCQLRLVDVFVLGVLETLQTIPRSPSSSCRRRRPSVFAYSHRRVCTIATIPRTSFSCGQSTTTNVESMHENLTRHRGFAGPALPHVYGNALPKSSSAPSPNAVLHHRRPIGAGQTARFRVRPRMTLLVDEPVRLETDCPLPEHLATTPSEASAEDGPHSRRTCLRRTRLRLSLSSTAGTILRELRSMRRGRSAGETAHPWSMHTATRNGAAFSVFGTTDDCVSKHDALRAFSAAPPGPWSAGGFVRCSVKVSSTNTHRPLACRDVSCPLVFSTMAPSAHLDGPDDHATKPVPKEGTGDLPHPQGEDNRLVVATRSCAGPNASAEDASAPIAADAALALAMTNTSNIQAIAAVIDNHHPGVAVDVSVASNGASIEFSIEPHGDDFGFEAVQHLLARAAGRDTPNMNGAVVAHAAASLAAHFTSGAGITIASVPTPTTSAQMPGCQCLAFSSSEQLARVFLQGWISIWAAEQEPGRYKGLDGLHRKQASSTRESKTMSNYNQGYYYPPGYYVPPNGQAVARVPGGNPVQGGPPAGAPNYQGHPAATAPYYGNAAYGGQGAMAGGAPNYQGYAAGYAPSGAYGNASSGGLGGHSGGAPLASAPAAPTGDNLFHCASCGRTKTPFYPGVVTQGDVCHPCYRYELRTNRQRPRELEQRRDDRVNNGGMR